MASAAHEAGTSETARRVVLFGWAAKGVVYKVAAAVPAILATKTYKGVEDRCRRVGSSASGTV